MFMFALVVVALECFVSAVPESRGPPGESNLIIGLPWGIVANQTWTLGNSSIWSYNGTIDSMWGTFTQPKAPTNAGTSNAWHVNVGGLGNFNDGDGTWPSETYKGIQLPGSQVENPNITSGVYYSYKGIATEIMTNCVAYSTATGGDQYEGSMGGSPDTFSEGQEIPFNITGLLGDSEYSQGYGSGPSYGAFFEIAQIVNYDANGNYLDLGPPDVCITSTMNAVVQFNTVDAENYCTDPAFGQGNFDPATFQCTLPSVTLNYGPC